MPIRLVAGLVDSLDNVTVDQLSQLLKVINVNQMCELNNTQLIEYCQKYDQLKFEVRYLINLNRAFMI